MLDHVGFSVFDFEKSKAFYQAVLAPLGYVLVVEVGKAQTGGGEHAGFGRDGRPQFWIGTGEPLTNGLHVAFAAPDRAAVDAFHQVALDIGARDNGAPGVREIYHPHYYGAFVIDPDGHNIEAVCHDAP